MAAVCVLLAVLRWAGVAVMVIALIAFFVGKMLARSDEHGRTVGMALVIGFVAFCITFLDLMFPLIVSLPSVIGAFMIGLSFAVPVLNGPRRVRRVGLLALFLAWLVFLSHAPWDPRKPFMRAYRHIRPGMTQLEVEQQFRREYPNELPAHRYTDTHWFFFCDLSDGRFNAEIISVEFSNGQVINAQYEPD